MQKIFMINIGFIILLSNNYFCASINQNSPLYLPVANLGANHLTKVNNNNLNKIQSIDDSVSKSQESEDVLSRPDKVLQEEFDLSGLLELADAAKDYVYESDGIVIADNEKSSEYEWKEDMDSASGSDTYTEGSSPIKRRKVSQSYTAPSSSDSSALRSRECKNWILSSAEKIKYTSEGSQYKVTTEIRTCISYFLFSYSFINKKCPLKYERLNNYIKLLEEDLLNLYNILYKGLDFCNLLNLYNAIDKKFFNIFILKKDLMGDVKVSIFLNAFVKLCQNIIDELNKIISSFPDKSTKSVYSYWIRDYDELVRRLELYDNVNFDVNLVCENMRIGDDPINNTSPIKTEVVDAFYQIYDISSQSFGNFLVEKGHHTTFTLDSLLEEFQKNPEHSSFLCFYYSNRNIFKFLYCTSRCNKSILKKFLSIYKQNFNNILYKIEHEFINIKLLLGNFNFSYESLKRYLKLCISSASAVYNVNDMIIKRS